MPDHDAIVVGAGPVGLLAACLLAQRGLDVGVYERHEGPDLRTRAIGIHPPGLAALDAAGIGGRVRAESLALHGGDVFSRGRMLASLDFPSERRVLILPQRRTTTLLRRRLDELAPGALHSGAEAGSVRDEGGFARATIDLAGKRRELTATWLLIADGVRSSLREGLGIGWRARPGAATYAMVDVPDAAPGARVALHCEPAGLVESFPLPDGGRRWVAREQPGSPLRSPEALRAVIRERIGRDVEIPPETHLALFRAAQHRAVRTAGSRIVLLGDAAHEISPIGGQGMNLGWVEAARVVEAIVDAPGAGASDLRAVARRNGRSTARVQRRARFYMSMGAPADGVPLRARETLIRMLGGPPLRAAVRDVITMARL